MILILKFFHIHHILQTVVTMTFFLFPSLKKTGKIEIILTAMRKLYWCAMTDLMSKKRVFYFHGLFKVKQRRQKCVNLDGGYTEKEEKTLYIISALYDMTFIVRPKTVVKTL